MVSQLPLPSSEAFDFLLKGLRPLGLTARSINLESPSNNLDDVALVLNLLDYNKFTLRITYSGIEAEGRDIYSENVLQILQILDIVFQSLEKIDSEVKKGTGIVRLSLHLNLLEKTVNDYISERVSAKLNDENIKPEAVVFTLEFDEFSRTFPTKITLAKSLAVEEGLFLDINYQSGKDDQDLQSKNPMEFFEMMADHYKYLLSFLDLNVIAEEEN